MKLTSCPDFYHTINIYNIHIKLAVCVNRFQLLQSSNKTHAVLVLSHRCAGLVGISFSVYLSIEDGCSDNAEAVVFRSAGWSHPCDRVLDWGGGGVDGQRHTLSPSRRKFTGLGAQTMFCSMVSV